MLLSAKQFDSCTFKHTSTLKLGSQVKTVLQRCPFSAVQREAGLPERDGGVGMGHGQIILKNKAEVLVGILGTLTSGEELPTLQVPRPAEQPAQQFTI